MADLRINSGDTNGPEVLALVRKACGGDYNAFGDLYSLFVTPIYRYVFYQVRDKMTAEDITEEVFVKAWKAIGSCRGQEDTFSAWLYRIAHNQVIDVFRRNNHQVPRFLTPADPPDPVREVEVKLEHEQLLKAIAGLPDDQRRVIVLKFIQGLDNQEIGHVTGKNQGAIRILQMRALARLRQDFGLEGQSNAY